jgi:hypothetical protein
LAYGVCCSLGFLQLDDEETLLILRERKQVNRPRIRAILLADALTLMAA